MKIKKIISKSKDGNQMEVVAIDGNFLHTLHVHKSKAAEKNVHVDSRSEVDLLANEMIRNLGLRKATYKIS